MWGGVIFFIALFHVLGHVDHFKTIKKSVNRVGKILTPPPSGPFAHFYGFFFFEAFPKSKIYDWTISLKSKAEQVGLITKSELGS